MQFGAIPDHHDLKASLIRAASTSRVAHAQLFIGGIGSANLALALAFATYLNCNDPEPSDACGRCFSCSSMQQLTHPDLLLVFPTTSKTPGEDSDAKEVDLFRDCIKKNPFTTLEEWASVSGCDGKQSQITRSEAIKIIQRIALKPFVGPYKIVLIWLPELLNHSAANTLLKTIEEPPLATLFLLVGVDGEKILPTIRSRVQPHRIAPFSQAAVAQLLRDKYATIEANHLEECAFLSQGDVHKAFQLAEQKNTDPFELFRDWMRNCYKPNYKNLLLASEAFHQWSTDNQKLFLHHGLALLRVTLLTKVNDAIVVASSNEKVFCQQFGLTVSIDQLKQMVTILNKGYTALERNGNGKMIYMAISIQMERVLRR